MDFRLDLLGADDLLDDALFVDDEGGANGAHVFAAVHRLFLPDAELLDELLVDVGDEWEVQVVLLDELTMLCVAVDADADDLHAGSEQLLAMVTYATGLGRAAARQVLWVEVEHELLATIVTQAYFTPLLVFAQNFGRFVSDVHDVEELGSWGVGEVSRIEMGSWGGGELGS